MILRSKIYIIVTLSLLLSCSSFMRAQQKGQYVPGQSGLNAGILPDPGFTFANLTLNYSANTLKDSNGNTVLRGSYGFWAPENIFYYVTGSKFLGAKFAPMIMLATANGSLTAPQFGVSGGGQGFADTWVQPVTLGWSLKRVDTYAAYAFVAPTGKYFPGASNNVGSGYWGNHFFTGTTAYLTKNKGTSLSLATDWEFHGQKRGTNVTPGQAFTDEWGLGQVLPLAKDFSKLLQFGVIGYDQWQVSANSGTVNGFPASLIPYYSVHAIGVQTNFILPTKGFNLFFKYEPEYSAKARPAGRTIVFGGTWTLRDPKPKTP